MESKINRKGLVEAELEIPMVEKGRLGNHIHSSIVDNGESEFHNAFDCQFSRDLGDTD